MRYFYARDFMLKSARDRDQLTLRAPFLSMWFEVCWGRTAWNSLKPALKTIYLLYYSGSRLGPTASNSVEPTLYTCFPLHHSGLRRFGGVQPLRTHSNLTLWALSMWFEPWWGRTAWNSLEPSLNTIYLLYVTKGEAGVQGSFEWVWCGSTPPNLL